MSAPELPADFVEQCRAVTAKRARTVIDHILEHGYITTEELRDQYGYNHPPRAARDVREQGIPLETFRVTGGDGRKIGAYRFRRSRPCSVQQAARSNCVHQRSEETSDRTVWRKVRYLS